MHSSVGGVEGPCSRTPSKPEEPNSALESTEHVERSGCHMDKVSKEPMLPFRFYQRVLTTEFECGPHRPDVGPVDVGLDQNEGEPGMSTWSTRGTTEDNQSNTFNLSPVFK